MYIFLWRITKKTQSQSLPSLPGKVIERREQWLHESKLLMNTLMDEYQKEAFLAEVIAEYHSSPDQLQRQQDDKDAGKSVGNRKRSRWVRETQRRGITHQMWQMLSFSGRWNPKFFENMPAPTQPGQCTEQQKKNTIAAAEARASVRYAKMCHHMQVTKKWWLTPSQASLVARLRDGSLEDEAQRLTIR